jgi:hypothetical protein
MRSSSSLATDHAPRAFDRKLVRRYVDSPEAWWATQGWRLSTGRELDRPLTLMERMALSVAACRPTHFLTIDSSLDRAEFGRCFAKLKKRLRRDRYQPLVYVATLASGLGDGGCHAHLVLWKSLCFNRLAWQVEDVGFGQCRLSPVESYEEATGTPIRLASYVLGQHEPVFRSRHHVRHQERAKFARRFSHPQRPTLGRYHPELLAALDLAKNPAVTDQDLYARLHIV